MAVYETRYRGYSGELTPRRTRFWILSRYAWREVFASRLVTGFFALCFALPLFAAGFIYLRYNGQLLTLLEVNPAGLLPVDATFFYYLLSIQGWLGFVLTALVGPGLVSPDLAHNALALYFSRPLTRSEYVLGKMAVLLVPLSAITWLPCLLLYVLEGGLAESGWFAAHWRAGIAILVGGAVWIVVLGFLGLAVSAWVRWRTVATGAIFAVHLVGLALGSILNNLFATSWGGLLKLGDAMQGVWRGLFGLVPSEGSLPLSASWITLAGLCMICTLLLRRRLRAYEEVR